MFDNTFISDRDMTVEHLRRNIAQFVSGRKWEQFHTPKNLAASIAIEAGELLECLQWIEDVDDVEKLSNELADVAIYCLALTNALGLDLASAIMHKLELNEAKYPVNQCSGDSFLDWQRDSCYPN